MFTKQFPIICTCENTYPHWTVRHKDCSFWNAIPRLKFEHFVVSHTMCRRDSSACLFFRRGCAVVYQFGSRKIVIRDALRVTVVTAVWLLGGGATWQNPSHSLRKEGGRLVRVQPGIRLKSLKQAFHRRGQMASWEALSCGGRGRKEER